MKAIGNSVALVATLGLLLSFGSAEEVVVFGDNVRLTPVKESSLDTAIKNKVVDPMNTGSRLFDATVVGKDTRLSLNFPVKKFMSNSLKYFRAHPAFLRCLQKTVNYVYQEHKTTIVLADKGFKTLDEAPGSTDVDKYSRSGAGAALKFPAGDTTDVKEIVKGILVHCPFIFGLEMRDIGVVLKANQVFVYMTGASDKEPHFESQTGMSTTDFKEWCLKQIDIAIDPVKTPSCDSYSTLASGTTYPTSATSPEGVVGKMDEAITRESADFKRLVQFARRKVVFEDSEHNSAWCGKIGNACIDCISGIKGQAPSSRCADRMMSPRLYRGMRVLQKLVREKISGDELKVIDAWDELYEGSPTNGDHGLISLHREGRAAILKLKNGAGKLAKLTQLAICSQMDYVKFDGDKVIVAVKKQANVEPVLVTFPENVLLDVAPPSSKATDYALPDDIIEDGTSNDYPLFDGNVNTKLGISSKTDDFHSTASRYFRAHPALVQCYDEIVSFEKRWTSGTVNIKIKKAFLTVQQQQEEVDTQRSNSHLLGQGLELAYDPALDTNKYSVHRLAKAAIDQCGPIFYKENWYIGIGVNANSVFVGMMEEKAFWANTLPSGVTAQQYRLSLEERFYMAVDGHVVDPLNPAEACTQVPVKKQSPNFKHEHPKHIVRRRKREISDDCVKSSNTAFCGETKTHRETESALIWVEVKRMHLYHNEQQVHDALKGCFEKCGNCVKGEIYETKTEHCNNFLHWAPFSLMNDDAHVTNLFYKDNDDMRKEACAGHCLDKAPLFAQLAPSLERLYRPDPKKSIEEELYGVMDNPLPVYELLVKMYAMHAKGKVTAWVKNEVEVDYIRSALEVVMLHNKEVTEVKIFVSDSTALMAVDGAVESMIADWVKSGCPTYTRETITPFKVLEMKSSRKKRSVEEFDLGQQLREKRKYFEQEWIQSSQIN